MLELNSKTKTVSATISENIIKKTDELLEYFKSEGYSVSRSAFIQSALKEYIKTVEENIAKRGGAV